LSGLAAGVIVDHLGYAAAFLTFGAAACTALAALFLAMLETAPDQAKAAEADPPEGPIKAMRTGGN
jgi:hypothetical protein